MLGIENIVSFSQDNTALLTKENGTQAMEKSLEDKNDNVKDPPKNRFRFPKPGFLKKSKAQRNPVADDSTAYFGGLPFPDIAGTYRSLIWQFLYKKHTEPICSSSKWSSVGNEGKTE